MNMEYLELFGILKYAIHIKKKEAILEYPNYQRAVYFNNYKSTKLIHVPQVVVFFVICVFFFLGGDAYHRAGMCPSLGFIELC